MRKRAVKFSGPGSDTGFRKQLHFVGDSARSNVFIQGGFFDCSALKMTKCQPLKEISELFLPKND